MGTYSKNENLKEDTPNKKTWKRPHIEELEVKKETAIGGMGGFDGAGFS